MKDYKIVVDSREQRPLWKTNVVVKKLDVGDYSLKGFEDKICIERKSPQDFWQTMLGGNKRFHKELKRAKTLDYFAVVVETNYTNIQKKEFEGAFHSHIKSFIPLQIAFTFHVKHGVPFFFCNGRVEAKKIIKELFNAYMRIKH